MTEVSMYDTPNVEKGPPPNSLNPVNSFAKAVETLIKR